MPTTPSPAIARGLCIRMPWVGFILDGLKDWEIRGANTHVRGTIALIQSGTGLIVGTADLIDVVGPLSQAELRRQQARHQVPRERIAQISYATPHAWVLANVRTLSTPVPYDHPSGAVIWVTLPPATQRALAAALTERPAPRRATTATARRGR